MRFDSGFASWDAALKASGGYADGAILDRVLAGTREVLGGQAESCRDGVVTASDERAWPVLAGLLRAAARDRGMLSVLDFGGALGGTFLQYRALLSGLRRLRWTVVEQAHMVDRARREIRLEELRFEHDVTAAVATEPPNVVLLASVLQYLEDPLGLLRQVAATGARTLIIDRTPLTSESRDSLLVQHAPARVGPECYPAWVFSEPTLLAELERTWTLRYRFDCPEGDYRIRGGLRFGYHGMLLERTQ